MFPMIVKEDCEHDGNWTDTGLATMLFMACIHDCPNIIEFLVANGVDINATTTRRSTSGRLPLLLLLTPLHVACHENHLQVCKILLAHGADINATDSDGRTPIQHATGFDNLEIFTYLMDHGANATSNEFMLMRMYSERRSANHIMWRKHGVTSNAHNVFKSLQQQQQLL
jgi:ankyrin repeat protein